MDSASLNWQKQRKCFTCHTNYSYLYARPGLATNASAHLEVRKFAEELVSERWKEKGPRWDAEVVATAAALAFNDAATTGKLHPVTKTALDRMWTLQKEDGGWKWLKCNWPPMESDDHYGVTLAAIAVGVAPEQYAQSEAAQKGLAGIRKYLAMNPPPTLHHKAMVLWAASYLDGIVADEVKSAWINDLQALQKDDGGWGLATLGDWKRADGKEQDKESSDGYGTGFVIYVLRRAGVPATSERVRRGIQWLKNHQRESGRWFTRSLNKDLEVNPRLRLPSLQSGTRFLKRIGSPGRWTGSSRMYAPNGQTHRIPAPGVRDDTVCNSGESATPAPLYQKKTRFK